MINKTMHGENKCWYCGYPISWDTTPKGRPGQVITYERPQCQAKEVAIGKNEDGTTKFEITCECKNCKTENKFIVDFK